MQGGFSGIQFQIQTSSHTAGLGLAYCGVRRVRKRVHAVGGGVFHHEPQSQSRVLWTAHTSPPSQTRVAAPGAPAPPLQA